MSMANWSKISGAGKAKCYRVSAEGVEICIVIFKATTERPAREPRDIFTAKLTDGFVEPADFYCGYAMVNGQVLDKWHVSSGYLGEAYDGAFLERADHKRINLPDELADQLDTDGNGDMATEGWGNGR